MPPPQPAHEVDGLLTFLERQRAGVRHAVAGISDAQARLTPIPSTTLSLGGLLKHVVVVERSWTRSDIEGGEDDRAPEEFTLLADETVADWLAAWTVEAAHTTELIGGGDRLDQEVVDPRGRPPINVRWVLLHLIEEVARHAGHADLLREAIDGQTSQP